MNLQRTAYCVFLVIFMVYRTHGQISPGELAEVHAHLEGMSNCTKCHHLGEKVTNEKCLDCHTEIKIRIEKQKGYHASTDIRGKECVKCHNDHHGRNFEIIRFDKEKFDHTLTGYLLTGAHSKKKCTDCHKPDFITDQEIKKKKFTYLGLGTECLSCHADYHQNTLTSGCNNCHNFDSFKPATKFDHQKAGFRLAGKHQSVDCLKCHAIEEKNGKKFQRFKPLQYDRCTNCHTDVHNNKFGQDCRQCHSEESFHIIKTLTGFDHDKTDFRLEGKHQAVTCKACHKTKLTDPVKHERCMDCHQDYHRNEFARQGVSPDCAECHDVRGFALSSYTIEQHNKGNFPLNGSHLAIPCFACHKKEERWKFREIGLTCINCHQDIHKDYIDSKYYPDANCRKCHSEESWNKIVFDHAVTGYLLTGAHSKQSCRSCHFAKENTGNVSQRFKGLSSNCVACHKDIHAGQFEKNGTTNCERCHDPENWKAAKFDHNKTQFILDGKHKEVACNKCHKEIRVNDITFVEYKIKDFRCEACHR